MRAFLLYLFTAAAEIIRSYSVYLWLRLDRTAWWLIPSIISLGLFAWLLTLHRMASGRIYAAYGDVYIGASILWLWLADGVQPTRWDLLGSATCLAGAALIYVAPRG